MNRRASALFLRCLVLSLLLLAPGSALFAQVAAQIRVETSADGLGTPVFPQSLPAGSSLTMYAIARDAGGVFLSNVSATWSLQGSTGGIVPGDLSPSSDGRSAIFTGHLIGTTAVRADSGGVPSTPSGTLTVIAGSPTTLSYVSGNNQTDQVDSTLAALVVRATDAYTNPVAGAGITYTITSAPGSGGGSVAPSSTDTGADGQASSSFTLGTKTGTYTVVAAPSGWTASSVTFSETALAGPPKRLYVETQADGGGTIVGATTIIPGQSVTGYSIARDSHDNFVGNIAATWTLVDVGGNVQQSDLHVGPGQMSAQFVGNLAGSGRMEATSTGLTPTPSGLITVQAGPATNLAFGQQPTNTAVNQLINPVTVRIVDSRGNVVTTASNSVTISLGPGSPGGTLSGTLTVAAVSGIATFNDLRINQIGTGYTLQAVSGALTGANSSSFNILAGAPTSIAVDTGDNQTGTVATPLVDPLVVRVKDASGYPVPGVQVTFAVATWPSGATGYAVSPQVATTNDSGRAGTSLTLGTVSGVYTVSAAVSGLSAVFNENAAAGPAARLGFGQQPTNTTAGAAINPPVTVRILDSQGNLVTTGSFSVALGIAHNPSGGTLTGGEPVTAVSGVATFSNLRIDRVGNGYTLQATSGTLPPVTSSPFNIVVGAAARLVYTSGDNQTATVTTQLPAPFVVTVTDAANNPVQGVAVAFAIVTDSIPPGATGTSLSVLNATTNSNGQASSRLTLGNRPGLYVISASSAGLAGSPVHFRATATVGPATQVRVETAANGTGVIVPAQTIAPGDSVVGYAISRDAEDNFIGNVVASWSLAGRTGNVVNSDLVAAPDNRSATFRAHGAGSARIRAAASGLTAVTSGTITVAAGVAVAVRVETAPDGSGIVVPDTTLAAGDSLTVYAVSRDGAGNYTGNVTATWQLTNVTGGVVAGDLIASSDGRSALFRGHVTGSAHISATSGSLSPTPSGLITVVAGAGSHIVVETAANGSGTVVPAQNRQAGVPLTVYAVTRDAAGNFVANVQASWSLINTVGGIVSGDLVPAGDNRSAVFTGHIVGTTQISATAGGATPVPSGIITVTPGPAARIRVETLADGSGTLVPTQSLTSGATLTVYAVTRDAFGNVVPSSGVVWSLAGITGGILPEDLTPTPDGRSATFAARHAGTARISATSGALEPVNSGVITVVAGAAVAMEIVSGDGQSGTVGTTLAAPFVARVTDSNGNPVGGVAVTFALGTIPQGAAGTALSATVVSTDSLGTARSTLTLGTLIGNYTVTASSPVLAGGLVTFTAVATPGPATQVRVESAPGGAGTLIAARSIASGSSLTVYAVARDVYSNFVRDTSANGLTGWTLESLTGGVLASDLVPSLDRRSAMFTGHLLGSAVIRANVTGLTSVPTGVITVATGGVAAVISVETAPNGLGTPVPARGLTSGDTLRVYAVFRDAAGNYLGNNPADGWSLKSVIGGLAAGDLVPSNDRRSALFTAHLAGSGVISAVSGVLDTVNSGRITVMPGPAAAVIVRSGSSQSAVVGTPFDSSLSVVVRDLSGNALGGVSVRFTAPASGASGTFALGARSVSVVTDANGIATAPLFTANTVIGTYTDTARVASVPVPAYFTLTNRAGAADTIVAVDGTPQTAQVGSAFAVNFAVSVRDRYGNPVTGVLVRFTPPATGPSGTFVDGRDTARTDVNGVATASGFMADSVAGSYTVSAAVPGSSFTPALFYLTNAAGPVGKIMASAGDPQTTQVNTDFAVRFRVRVLDAADNPVQNALVTFRAPVTPTTAPSGTFGTATTDTSRTDNNGYATAAVFHANTHAGSFTVNATVEGAAAPAAFHLTNTAAPLDTFIVEAAGGGAIGARVATEPFTIRVAARDAYGNTVTSFTGTVEVSANLPLLVGGGRSRAFSGGLLEDDTIAVARSGNATINVQRTGGAETGRSETFSVSNPAPRILSVSPTNARAGESVDVIIRGTGFISGVTTVTFGDRISTTTTVDSTTRLTVNIRIDATAPAGPRNVTVINAPPGGGTDIQVNGFTIGDNPVPTLTSLQPVSGMQGQSLNVVLRGTNFLGGVSTVDFGSGIAVNSTTVDSSTRMTARITIDGAAAIATRDVRVTNGPPGGGASNALSFTVTANPFLVPLPVAPLDSAVNEPTVVTLRWRQAGTVQSYWLQVGRDTSWSASALVLNDSLITDTLRQVGPLSGASTYFWRVRALYSGGRSGWSSTRRFATGSSSYPSTITVATTVPFPSYETAADYQATDYRIVGLPGASDTAVTALLGGTPGGDWQMYWDNGDTASYLQEYSGADTVFRFTTGRAFWLIKKGNWSVGTVVRSAAHDQADNVFIPLHPGWNLITNPHSEPIDWSAVQNANGNLPQPIWGYQGAFTRPVRFSSDSCAGYYFLNSGNLTALKVPRIAGSGKIVGSDTSGWRVSISLEWDNHIDRTTEIGESPQASEGLDRLDIRKPHGPGNVPGIFFSHPEWDPVYSSFASDIRAGGNPLERWELSITGPPHKKMRLGFEGVERVPAQCDIKLIDAERGRAVDLRSLGSNKYSFTSTGGATKIRLVVGTHDAVAQESDNVLPKEFALGQNFPNPFNPVTTIPVDVPRTARVTLTVYSLLGQEVATVQDGVLEPGRYWFTWAGNNNHGSIVATGVYVVRMTTDTGVQYVRKMLFMK